MAEYQHDMNVKKLSEVEAKAIVLSLRTLLSFGEKTNLSFRHLYDIAYGRDKASLALRQVMEMDENG